MSKKILELEQPITDFNKWSYREFSEYFNAYNRADTDRMNAIILSTIGVDAATLDIEASTKLKYDVLMAMNTFIEGLDYSDVKVDFKRAKWTDVEFAAYRKASTRGDIETAERCLKEVCILEGVDPHAALSAPQGGKMAQAIVKAYRDMLTGKI